MVIGGMSFLMLVMGVLLTTCIAFAHREMATWERRVLGCVAAFGVSLLPILGLFGF
jgi:hypothetical protein